MLQGRIAFTICHQAQRRSKAFAMCVFAQWSSLAAFQHVILRSFRETREGTIFLRLPSSQSAPSRFSS